MDWRLIVALCSFVIGLMITAVFLSQQLSPMAGGVFLFGVFGVVVSGLYVRDRFYAWKRDRDNPKRYLPKLRD